MSYLEQIGIAFAVCLALHGAFLLATAREKHAYESILHRKCPALRWTVCSYPVPSEFPFDKFYDHCLRSIAQVRSCNDNVTYRTEHGFPGRAPVLRLQDKRISISPTGWITWQLILPIAILVIKPQIGIIYITIYLLMILYDYPGESWFILSSAEQDGDWERQTG